MTWNKVRKSAVKIYSPAFSSSANATPDLANLGDLEKSSLNASALEIRQCGGEFGAENMTDIRKF